VGDLRTHIAVYGDRYAFSVIKVNCGGGQGQNRVALDAGNTFRATHYIGILFRQNTGIVFCRCCGDLYRRYVF
jgi:hypothetical protein